VQLIILGLDLYIKNQIPHNSGQSAPVVRKLCHHRDIQINALNVIGWSPLLKVCIDYSLQLSRQLDPIPYTELLDK
jgi:hypothetical protein